jgi:hypothetical protein
MGYGYTEMQAVELNSQTGARVGPDRVVRRHKSALVSSGDVEFSPARFEAGRAIFTAAEMRHVFAIWAVKNTSDISRQRHLFYCIRCKQAYIVDDRGGSVTPLDSQGNTLQGSEAIRRLNTFSSGPCAAFGGLTGPRFASKIIPIHTARERLTYLTSAGRRAWKALMAHWHRLPTVDRTSRNDRSKGNEHEATASR